MPPDRIAPVPDRAPPSDATRRFSSRVADYAAHRPRYPVELYVFLRESLGLRAGTVVADLGSGTGIFAEPLLSAGCVVYCAEPNAPMREQAERELAARFPNFHSINGAAEATTLPPASVDFVVAAQAFHWFDPAKAAAESRRVLRPGGSAAMVWNTRKVGGSAFHDDYEALLNRYGTDYAAVRHDRNERGRLGTYFSQGYQRVTFPNAQRLDLAGLRGRLLSSSYTPGADDPRRAGMLEAADALFSRHQRGGAVTMEYDTELYYGTP